jgi:hypothetical protein
MTESLGGLASAFGSTSAAAAGAGVSGSTGGGLLDIIGSLFGGGATSTKGTPVYVTNMPGGGIGTTGGTGSSVLDILNGVTGMFPNSPANPNAFDVFGGGTDGPNALLDTVNGLFKTYPNSSAQTPGINGGAQSGGILDSAWSTIKNIGSGVIDVVSSIGSGISDFFGGWFANGGSLQSGKFGIVGERGPELISGPATITPMNGLGSGTTNITYNINAVDAMSFKQLVAADPQFIYAVTMQGQKGMRA